MALSEIVRNVAIVIGGAIGIYLAWKRVSAANRQAEAQTKQAELQRRVFVDDLFNRAVSQLKDKKLEVRLGAIFTLRQICDDYPDLSRPILETMAAYVRESRVEYGDDLPPADIREVMNMLRDKLGGTG